MTILMDEFEKKSIVKLTIQFLNCFAMRSLLLLMVTQIGKIVIGTYVNSSCFSPRWMR